MHSSDIAVLGLGTMGRNVAMNLARHGFAVTVFNRTWEKTQSFMAGPAKEASVIAARDLQACVASLSTPRNILLMVKAGEPVHEILDKLQPLLSPGDTIMDGGNSHFSQTEYRVRQLAEQGINFLGVGISGGEHGALTGPSIMAGGALSGWKQVQPLLTAVAARAHDNHPCATYVGMDGAGHFVKMVHNGIEYAFMQVLAEAYALFTHGAGLTPLETATIFDGWNVGVLKSYLVEITAQILRTLINDTPLVELILDKAEHTGTGKWTTQTALDLGVAIPSITAAVDARLLSALKHERIHAAACFPDQGRTGITARPATLEQAVLFATLCVHAQAFALVQEAERLWRWGMDPAQILRTWRAGCIIRAALLDNLAMAFDNQPHLPNLLLAPELQPWLHAGQHAMRETVASATQAGIPVPVMSASLTYFDSYRSASLPANLIQAQRDFFGAHQFEWMDKPGRVHWEW